MLLSLPVLYVYLFSLCSRSVSTESHPYLTQEEAMAHWRLRRRNACWSRHTWRFLRSTRVPPPMPRSAWIVMVHPRALCKVEASVPPIRFYHSLLCFVFLSNWLLTSLLVSLCLVLVFDWRWFDCFLKLAMLKEAVERRGSGRRRQANARACSVPVRGGRADLFDEVLEARKKLLDLCSGGSGLRPPDLCKSSRRSLLRYSDGLSCLCSLIFLFYSSPSVLRSKKFMLE